MEKSLRDFIKASKKLLDLKSFVKCKTMVETALKNRTYGEIPQDARIYLYCGIANLNLKYMIIAEQMFLRCMVEPDIVSEAQRHLALVYGEQGHLEKSAEMYKAALM